MARRRSWVKADNPFWSNHVVAWSRSAPEAALLPETRSAAPSPSSARHLSDGGSIARPLLAVSTNAASWTTQESKIAGASAAEVPASFSPSCRPDRVVPL